MPKPKSTEPLREQFIAVIDSSGRTISELAAAAGINRSSLSNFYHGSRDQRLNDRQLDALAEALGTRVRLLQA